MPENTRGPKVHPADLHLAATEAANVAGMIASGQPLQDDCAGFATSDLLDAPSKAAESDSKPLVEAEAPVVPAKPKKAKKAAPKK